MHAGLSDARIEQLVVARFGEQALLVPSGSGVDVLLWVLPVVGLGVAGGSARRLPVEATPPRGVEVSHRRTITGRDPGRSSPEALADEREFLVQSIDDLEAERAAGEVDEEDFTVLAARYGERLAEVEAAQAGGRRPELSGQATAGMAAPRRGPMGREVSPLRLTGSLRPGGGFAASSASGGYGSWSGSPPRAVSLWRRACSQPRSPEFASQVSRRPAQ